MPRAATSAIARKSARPFRIERGDRSLRFHRSLRHWPLAVFLLFWIAIWSCGCVMLAQRVWTQPSLQMVLFATPFFVAWLGVSAILAHAIAGREDVQLGPEGLEYCLRAIVPLHRRVVPLDQIRLIVVGLEPPGSPGDQDAAEPPLQVVTLGAPLSLGAGLSLEQREALASALRETLSELRSGGPAANLASPDDLPPLPDDTRLQIEHDWDRLIVRRRSPFDLAAFAGLTFFTLFWDGIVGLFLLEFFTKAKAFSLSMLILLPHTIIGLFLLLVWFNTVLAPFTRRTWTFKPGEITVRQTVFGLGRVHRIVGVEPTRVEFRKVGVRSRRRRGARDGSEPPDALPFAVALVGSDGAELLTIDGLSEGEARRLAGELETTYRRSLTSQPAPTLSMPVGLGDADPLFDRWTDL